MIFCSGDDGDHIHGDDRLGVCDPVHNAYYEHVGGRAGVWPKEEAATAPAG